MFNHLYIPLLITFPETFLIVLLGLSMSKNKNISIVLVLCISFIQSIFVGTLLMLELSSEINTILQIFLICILTTLILNIPMHKAVVPVLMGCLIVGGLQSVIFPILSNVLNIDILQLKENIFYSIKFYYPVFIITILLFIILKKKQYHLYDI